MDGERNKVERAAEQVLKEMRLALTAKSSSHGIKVYEERLAEVGLATPEEKSPRPTLFGEWRSSIGG